MAVDFLEWDSAFFGARLARVRGDVLSPETAAAVEARCRAERIDAVYFLARPDDPLTVETAAAHGYVPVDVRVELDAMLPPPAGAASAVRPARPDDGPALVEIARTGYRDTRFYHDRRFPRERCDALYETWIAKALAGSAEAVLVADDGTGPAGFISCHLEHEGRHGRIGLTGVADRARGRGVGTALVRASLAWFAAAGARRALVVTQGRNVGAQRLYQGCGFRTAAVHLWFHKWFTAWGASS